ncbi:MAG: hypothetical protein LBD36_03390 [Holosporales bacterium]|nr:hypothetical protein [Holosporales bacterium]
MLCSLKTDYQDRLVFYQLSIISAYLILTQNNIYLITTGLLLCSFLSFYLLYVENFDKKYYATFRLQILASSCITCGLFMLIKDFSINNNANLDISNCWTIFATGLTFVGIIIRTDLLPFAQYYTSVSDSLSTTFLSQGVILPISLVLLLKLSIYYVRYEYYSTILLYVSIIGLIVSSIKSLFNNNIYKATNFHTLGIINLTVFLQSIHLYNSAKYILLYYFLFKTCLLILTENICSIMSKETDIATMGGLKNYTKITFTLYLFTSISSIIVLLSRNVYAPLYEVFAGSHKTFVICIYTLFCAAHSIGFARLIYSIFLGNNRSNDFVFARIKEVPFVRLIPIIISVIGMFLYICLFKITRFSYLDSNLRIFQLIHYIICGSVFFASCFMQKLLIKHNVKITNTFFKKMFNVKINEHVIRLARNVYCFLHNMLASKKIVTLPRNIEHFYRKLEILRLDVASLYQQFLMLTIVIFGVIFILLFITLHKTQ